MKIIAGLKKIKHLDRKIKQNLERISKWSSYFTDEVDEEGPLYTADDIQKMQQSINDMSMEKARIRHAIHVTNANIQVEFKTKLMTVDELLLLKELVIPAALQSERALQRKEKNHRNFQPDVKVKVVMQYDARNKERNIDGLMYDLEVIGEILDRVTLEADLVGM